MIHYIKEKEFFIVTLFFVILLIVLVSGSALQDYFSAKVEHTAKMYPSVLELRITQYKQILKADEAKHEEYLRSLQSLVKK